MMAMARQGLSLVTDIVQSGVQQLKGNIDEYAVRSETPISCKVALHLPRKAIHLTAGILGENKMAAVHRLAQKLRAECELNNDLWLWEVHIKPAAEMAKQLAKEFNVDESIMVAAVYLHDLNRILGLREQTPDEVIEVAIQMMREMGFDEKRISIISEVLSKYNHKQYSDSLLLEILSVSDTASHFNKDFWDTLVRRKYPWGATRKGRLRYYLKKLDADLGAIKSFMERRDSKVIPARLPQIYFLYETYRRIFEQGLQAMPTSEFEKTIAGIEDTVDSMLLKVGEQLKKGEYEQAQLLYSKIIKQTRQAILTGEKMLAGLASQDNPQELAKIYDQLAHSWFAIAEILEVQAELGRKKTYSEAVEVYNQVIAFFQRELKIIEGRESSEFVDAIQHKLSFAALGKRNALAKGPS